jgi:hypothetical protein
MISECDRAGHDVTSAVEEGSVQMLQVQLSKNKKTLTGASLQHETRAAALPATLADSPACAALHNRGSHFSVTIEVGTPGQSFDVVADTGSDSVIVSSCLCQEIHSCSEVDSCFIGTDRSTTFFLRDEDNPSKNPHASGVAITFGSGTITSMVATDVVRVGQVQAVMTDGLLLMVKRDLRISGPFEGILGLGLPRQENSSQKLPFHVSNKGFLETAGITSFSVCFIEGAGGALRMGVPPKPNALKSIGQHHWGLSFHGISLGASGMSSAIFCTDALPLPGQETPCGAIPDSGTTLLMGPHEHLKLLFAALCDAWPRCSEYSPQHQGRGAKLGPLSQWTQSSDHVQKPDMPEVAAHERFQLVLLECEKWMNESQGLDELPPLDFHLSDATGASQVLKLKPADYVMLVEQEETVYITKHLMGIFPVRVPVHTGRMKKVCMPAFGGHKYDTVKNGPIWILGTPLFFAFEVGYDMQSVPPAIYFSEDAREACEGSVAMVEKSRTTRNWPREQRGPLRLPSVDTSLPL